jgi:xylulokinase
LGTEPSDASSTLLFDPHTRRWSAPLLQIAGLRPEQLPPVFESAQIAGELLPAFAAQCGLPAGVAVVFGGSDQACQAFGQGVFDPGALTVTIGTGGQLFTPLARPVHDPELRLHLFCHIAPHIWHLEAAMLSAGLSLRWLRDAAATGRSYGDLADAAAGVSAAGEGLFFLPYLAGERSPHMDPAARAAFIGLGLNHSTAHLVRAVMEGVVFGLRQGLDLMLGLGVHVDRVIATGGATRHPLWLRLLADTFARPIYPAHTPEATGFGAALLAGVGAGAWPDCSRAVAALPRPEAAAILPDAGQTSLYEIFYERYKEIYPAVRSLSQPAFDDQNK